MNSLVTWQRLAGRIVAGHRVASGANGDPYFPGGTVKMQIPHFRVLGLDLAGYHPGTLNVCVAPMQYKVCAPRHTFRAVKWHSTEPPEDFSFFDVRLIRPNRPAMAGLIYYPHPETKPAHFQRSDVLELLLPFIDDVEYDDAITLEIPVAQMAITPTQTLNSTSR